MVEGIYLFGRSFELHVQPIILSQNGGVLRGQRGTNVKEGLDAFGVLSGLEDLAEGVKCQVAKSLPFFFFNANWNCIVVLAALPKL